MGLPASRCRLLLVEDNPAQARLIRDQLGEADPTGFEVTHAPTLAGALAAARSDRFDVALLDLGLPDSEPAGTLAAFQAGAPGLPVVVLTGTDDRDQGVLAVRNGAEDFLVKGQGDGRVLCRALRHAVERHATRVAMAEYRREVAQRTDAERELARAYVALQHERERQQRELARELHDSIGQSLVAMKMTLDHVATRFKDSLDPDAREAIAGLTAMCSSLMSEVRAISHGLYPPGLEGLGLVMALEHLVAESSAGLPIAIEAPEDGVPRLPAETEIAVFRIVQEALSNALRHSGAGRVTVRLVLEAGELTVTVEDDGQGFDVASAAGKGLGLVSMRERALAAGGHLAVSSGPCGTRVKVCVPAQERQNDGHGPA